MQRAVKKRAFRKDEKMPVIHVIGLQLLCNTNKEGMLEKAAKLIEKAMENQKMVDLIAAPEMYYQRFGGDSSQEEFGEEPGGRFEAFWKEIARTYHTNVVTGSYAVKTQNEEKVKNRALVIDREGKLVGYYDKLHLFDAYGVCESDWSLAGNSLGLFDLDIGRIGIEICYDLRFPEEARALSMSGAKFLVIPAAFHQPRFDHWELLVRTTSVVNLLPVLAVNQSGKTERDRNGFVGRSMLTDAEGRILAQASDGEGYFLGEIDFETVKAVRKKNPAFQNQRRDLYKEWIQ